MPFSSRLAHNFQPEYQYQNLRRSPNPQMALRVLPLPHSKFPLRHSKTQFLCQPFPLPPTFSLHTSLKPQNFRTNNSLNDADLAFDFAMEVEKMNALQVQREEAMGKSRELLFEEVCKHLGVRGEELKRKWKSMGEDEKWDCVRGFVSDWGENFKPLSVRSVKDMVEEHLDEDNRNSGSKSDLFSGFKKFLGF